MVQVEDVHKRFGSLEVLRGISFDVQPGEVVVIIGPSGKRSGKGQVSAKAITSDGRKDSDRATLVCAPAGA